MKIADRITVLKDGKIMGTKKAENMTIDEVVNLMVGKELKFKYSDVRKYHQNHRENETPVLEVKNFTAKERARDISFKVYEKEIIGNSGRFSIPFKGFLNSVKIGDYFYINDGIIKVEVKKRMKNILHCLGNFNFISLY